MEQKETHELIVNFAKKGFLLDRELVEFFGKINDMAFAEETLNYLQTATKSRLITKKLLQEHLAIIAKHAGILGKEKQAIFAEYFGAVIGGAASSDPAVLISKNADSLINKEYHPDLRILSSNVIPYRRIEVKDFVTHIRNRFVFLREIIRGRKELTNPVSIDKISNNKSFSIICIVSNKRITKNKNIILEVEDLTGRVNVLINKDRGELAVKAREIVPDDVIGIKCSGTSDFIYANEIFFPDCFANEKRKLEEEEYAIFLSDAHVGSKLFLEKNFLKFIHWINGEGLDEVGKAKIGKIKYIFMAGDNIDGVGIYPGQEALLEIKDLGGQYRKLAEYLAMIPKHIKIILCPGQHDAVRVPEPQPAIEDEFAKELTEMKNVYLVSNPAMLEIGCTKKKNGFKVLMYHGASMIRNWVDEVEELRTSQAYLNPSKISKYMLRHRHLSPTHSSNVYVPSDKEDMMLVKEAPDIFVTGDLHKADVDIYNNILCIACSCWQSTTPFEEKVGNHPDPCKVPMLNLKTRELKILDFSGEE